MLKERVATISPSHAVGLEHQSHLLQKIRESLSSSHTVGSERGKLGEWVRCFLELKSPSHTVGLERRRCAMRLISFEVLLSPSHTVGLERHQATAEIITLLTSPSHTVGSEPRDVPKEFFHRVSSPSHTVGSERKVIVKFPPKEGFVTIPHGGLGTCCEDLRTDHNIQ